MNPFAKWSDSDVAIFNTKAQRKSDAQISTDGVDRESDLHAQIFDECRRRGWIALHGSMAERTHRTAGEPDFVILGTKIYLVECKTRIGKLSIAQQAMIAHAAKLGHTIHIVRSFEEFLNILG